MIGLDYGKRLAGLAGAVALVASCSDALTSRVDTVARAEGYELGVEPLAELVATGKGLPLRRDVVEEISSYWVDYVILADRLARGDSLMDSATVMAAMWAETQQEIADRYHARLVASRISLDSAQLDSAYAVGRHRLINQILFRVSPDASPPVRAERRSQAEDYSRRLHAGRITWAKAAEASDDNPARGGSLGVITHGDAVEAFENVAFALEPGEISEVVETADGYHIIYRPRLADAREEYRTELEMRLEDDFNNGYLSSLMARWNIEVRSGIAPAVREVGSNPLRAKSSRRVLGSHRGGAFRVSDLARWLQAMPVELRRQLPAASDSQVTVLVRTLIRNDALLHEARDSGVTISPEFVDQARDGLRRQVALLTALLGMPLDSLAGMRTLAPEARHALVGQRVLAYLKALSQNQKRLQVVPPFLADALRARSEWSLVPAGVERTIERARHIRLALDTSTTNRAPPPEVPPPSAAEPPGDSSGR
jgi:hypothetical protein